MSHFLWGLGELANDPSSTLISTLQRHLFKKASGNDTIITTETTSKLVSKNNIDSNNLSLVSTQEATCSKLDKSPSTKSKRVQVGAGISKSRHLSTQCSAILLEKSNKATSVTNVPSYDRGCTTTVVKIIDAATEPEPEKICDDHKQVLNTLRKWHATKKTIRIKEIKQNKVIVLKDKLLEILKLFKLEKIQSIPRYRGIDMEIMKLYNSVSLDEVSDLSEVTQKDRSS